jgi:hypothetical protein
MNSNGIDVTSGIPMAISAGAIARNGSSSIKGEDEQSVEHVQRSQPLRMKLRVGEERLHKHEQEQNHGQCEDVPPHSADDRGNEHQDRYEVEDDEAPLPVRLHAFAAEDTKACEEELDRNSKDKQPSKPDEELARYFH